MEDCIFTFTNHLSNLHIYKDSPNGRAMPNNATAFLFLSNLVRFFGANVIATLALRFDRPVIFTFTNHLSHLHLYKDSPNGSAMPNNATAFLFLRNLVRFFGANVIATLALRFDRPVTLNEK